MEVGAFRRGLDPSEIGIGQPGHGGNVRHRECFACHIGPGRQFAVQGAHGSDGALALMLATVVLIKMKRQRYIWVTMLPAVWLLICTTTAGFIKLFDANPAIGFLSLAKKYSDALANGQILAPAKSIDQMQHVIWNAYTNATLTALFLFVVFSILFYALKVGVAAWGSKERTDKEAPFQAMPDA